MATTVTNFTLVVIFGTFSNFLFRIEIIEICGFSTTFTVPSFAFIARFNFITIGVTKAI